MGIKTTLQRVAFHLESSRRRCSKSAERRQKEYREHARRSLRFPEQLEDRRLLATITWINPAGGDWAVPSNWNLNRVPSAVDDVVIPDLGNSGNDLFIALNSGVREAMSINNAETLRITSGSLTDYSNLSGSGVVEVAGGTFSFIGANWINSSTVNIVSGSLSLGGSFTQVNAGTVNNAGGTVYIDGTLTGGLNLNATTGPWYLQSGTIDGGVITTQGTNTLRGAPGGSNGVLAGVTIAAGSTVDFGAETTFVNISNGLTIHGTMLMGNEAGTTSARLTLGGTQSIGGTGTIRFGGLSSFYTTTFTPNTTYTFGPNLTIQGKRVAFVGQGLGSNQTYVLNGLLQIETGGGGLVVSSPANFETNGVISMAAGTSLNVQADNQWRHTGILNSGNNSTVTAYNLLNTGALNIGDSTLNLYGTFTQADVGIVTRTNGRINLGGTLTGGLSLDATTGPWYLQGGTINGGTITTQGNNTLRGAPSGSNGVLNGVTIAAGSTVDFGAETTTVSILNGLTIHGTMLMGNEAGTTRATLTLGGTQTVGGIGTIRFGSGFNGFLTTTFTPNTTYTFGPNLALQGKRVAFVGQGLGANQTYVLNGSLQIEAGGGGLVVSSPANFETNGVITMADGTSLNVQADNQWRHAGILTSGTNGTINAYNLRNMGTLTLGVSTLNLYGNFTQADVGRVTQIAGLERQINIRGTLTGGLHLDESTGPWYLLEGTIQGGTITTEGTNTLRNASLGGSGSTLSGVTIAANSVFDGGDSILNVINGLTIHGTLLLGDSGGSLRTTVYLHGTQSIDGTGSIRFGKHFANTILAQTAGSTYTFGSSLTIQGLSGSFSTNITNGLPTFVLNGLLDIENGGSGFRFSSVVKNLQTNGTVRVETGGLLTIEAGPVWTHSGVLDIDGGTINASLANVSNLATGVLTGGTWNIRSGGTLRLPSSVSTNRANLAIDGPNSKIYVGASGTSDAIGSLALNDTAGTLRLVNGSTLIPNQNFVNQGTLEIGVGSTLGVAPITDTIISHYRAENDINDALGTNPGTAPNGVSYASGVQGQAFSFNGNNQYISIPDSASLRPTNLTISTWFRFSSSSSLASIVAKPIGNSFMDSYTLWYQNGSLNAGLAVGNPANPSFVSTSTGYSIDLNAWHHVALAFDDNADLLKLYVDGIFRNAISVSSSIAYDTRPLILGADIENTALNYFFPGRIDETMLFSRALSDRDIRAIYIDQGTPPIALIQNSGTTTVDGSLGFEAGATINGGTLGGAGDIYSNVVNASGVLAPGSSLGTLDIHGNYTQAATARTAIQIGGTTVGVSYDQLNVDGTTTLDGTLDITLADGFGPSIGQNFQPITFLSRMGGFSTVSIPNYHGSPFFTSSLSSTDLQLQTVVQSPNLELDTFSIPSSKKFGESFSINYSATNPSGQVAYGSWTDSVYLSNDRTLDANDTLVGQRTQTADVLTGANYAGTITATIPGIVGGRYFVIVSANTPFALPETSRADNARSSADTMAISLDENPIIFNQQLIGRIESPYAVDRWMFTGGVGQSVSLSQVSLQTPNAVHFKLTGPNGEILFSDLTTDSDTIVLPATGDYVLEVNSRNGGSGNYSFRLDQLSPTPLTLNSPYLSSFSASGLTQAFKASLTQAGPIRIVLDGAINTDEISIFSRLGSLPTRRGNEQHGVSIGADHVLEVPLATPGDLFIVLISERVSAPSSFTLEVQTIPVSVTKVTPNSYETGTASARMIIEGLGFLPGSQVYLIPAAGPAIAAQSVSIDRSTQITAALNLTAVPVGDYGVRVVLPGGAGMTLSTSFHVQNVGAGSLVTNLSVPSVLGRHQPATLYLTYANEGTAAITAPLLQVYSQDPDGSDKPLFTLDKKLQGQGLWTTAVPDGFANDVSVYASGAIPGLLLPGESFAVPIYWGGLQAPWDFADDAIELGINIIDESDTRSIDYLVDFPKPDWITADAWLPIRDNLQQQIGNTWGGYIRMLSRDASYLQRFGQDVKDVGELYRFEVEKANGLSAFGALSSAVDAVVTAAGLPISISRSYGNSIVSRHKVGLFGRGWDAPAQAYLEVQPDGTLVVHESNEGLRRFQPDIRRTGSYFSPVGDLSVMKKIGNEYEVTETSGYKSRYQADGKITYEQDINGNRVTYGYTGSQVTSMTSANGESITIAYNAAGRISSVTESTGRTTTYNYDPTNSLLLSATGPSGTTSYTYSIGNGAAREFALTSETGPDGKTVHYEYNPRGELIASYLGANLQRVDLAYDGLGQVTPTDQGGVSSHAFFDHLGLLVRSEDALGHYVVYEYNELRQLIKTTDDLGRTTSYTRCDCGRPKTITDVYGRTILTFELDGPNNQPLSFKDANNNVTKYTYDTVGNVTSTTYPDGTFERATYDAKGNLDTTTNRRGQIVDRTTNAQGQVTHEVWSDGTIRDYVYDGRGRLRTATDSLKGTTTLTYDAADRLTRIDYPGGRWITYAYDNAGRRTQIADNSGFATNYSYTAAGQLEYLRDASNAILVHYSYDAAGRLSREDKGNGTYTVYGYDVAGRETSIFNYAPNGSVNSKFIYTYDAAGRRDTQTTIDGVWTYSYDLVDQLTRAIFVSTNPLIANQDLNYEYDALGNRTRTILNGATTEYVSNNMNQYTTTGGTTFVYDTDGNLIREISTNGIKLYAYDQLNRLIHVETPDGIWDYEYDVLGNRTAVIANGLRTEYLIDPAGLGNVVGKYNSSGHRTVNYTHGLGLESMSEMSEISYYDFDAIGSTVGLSESVGQYVNRYAYDPWGESLIRNEATENDFEFVGKFGVMDANNGLFFMRERYYGPARGRMLSQDPIRLNGNSTNLYAYAQNSPLDNVDPSGLQAVPPRGPRPLPSPPQNPLNPACDFFIKKIAGKVLNVGYCAENPTGCTDPTSGPADVLGDVVADSICRIPNDITMGWVFYTLEEEACMIDPSTCSSPDPKPDPPEPDIPVCIDPLQSGGGNGEGEGGTCNPGPKPPSPRPIDPNEKLASTGFGPQKFIAPETEIPYRINFENLGPGSVPPPTTPATAPAQRVDVTDDLSPLLDWNSFYFTGFGWGDIVIDVPLGLTYFFSTVGMTYNGKFFNVEVEMNFDKDTGKLAVSYQSVDPTNQLPPEVLTGFLPPEDGTNRGKGYLTFNVKPKTSLASGTELRNVANIRFDFLETIATNQIDPQNPAAGNDPKKEALNTIDAGLPTSSVTPLSPLTTELSFNVTWSGSDDANGSGIAGYDVYVSDNGGLPSIFQSNVTTTSAVFTGLMGHTYSFTTVAIDNVGHRELLATQADTQITIVGLSLSSSSIAENLAAGSLLGNLQSQFFPQNPSVTFELVGGMGSTDNSQFEIVGSAVKTKAKFDYETKASYSIRVRATNAAGQSAEKVFAIAVSDLPEVQVTTINSGAAQRSLVREVQVTFDGLVDFVDLNAADETQRPFKVRKRGVGGGLVTTTANVSNVAGKTVVRLTFSGAFTEDLGSLVDGNYDLVINSAKISRGGTLLDGDANGIAGGDSFFGRDALDRVVATDKFFRLLGDADGDAVVSNTDLAAFNKTYRAQIGQAAFNALFDFDSNGVVDNNDLRRMNAQYRKRLTFN